MTVSVWVVLIEAADTRSTGGVSYESVQSLLGRLSRHYASGLYAPDRYAVQLVLRTTGPASAIQTALAVWQDALSACGLPEWELVRAEVKTIGEFQAELAAEAAAATSTCFPMLEELDVAAEPWSAPRGARPPTSAGGATVPRSWYLD